MNGKMRGLVAGLLASAVSRAQLPQTQKEPVAWLYNGVRLPKLPDSDMPYAGITWSDMVTGESETLYASLYLSNAPFYKCDTITAFSMSAAKTEVSVVCYYWDINYSEWVRTPDEDFTEPAWDGENTSMFADGLRAITFNEWTNYDVLNWSDDSVFFAASEPVPVYE